MEAQNIQRRYRSEIAIPYAFFAVATTTTIARYVMNRQGMNNI